MSSERSAELIAVWEKEVAHTDFRYLSQNDIEAIHFALLAAAEAREAPAPEVIPGTREAHQALTRIHAIASRQLAEPAGAGDAVAMAKICTEVEAVHLPINTTQPTAADQALSLSELQIKHAELAVELFNAESRLEKAEQVIEAAKKACLFADHWLRVAGELKEANPVQDALDKISRWKEVNGG